MNKKVKQQVGDKAAVAIWYSRIEAAGNSPWLASLLLKRASHVRQRLAYFYDRLAQLPRQWRRRLQLSAAAGLLGAALLLSMGRSPSVHAAAITVGGDCSLVEAIENANDTVNGQPNTDCAAGDPSGADAIILSGATYTYSSAFGVDSALPGINSEITIEGNGATISRDAAAPGFQIFAVGAVGDLTLNQVTVSGGSSTLGGGIYSRGDLTLNEVIVSGNSASEGGGILNMGNLTISNSTISGNTATRSGGGIMSGNYFSLGLDTTIINNSTISGNSAGSSGGGIYSYAFYNGSTVTLNGSTVSGNTAVYRGGGIANSSWRYGSVSMTLKNSTVSGNSTEGYGGAIANSSAIYSYADLLLISSTVSGNTADVGGGIFNSESPAYGYYYHYSTLEMSQSLVSGNTANSGSEIVNYAEATGDDYNLFGHEGVTSAQAFIDFTPGASDITATSNGTDPTALSDILDTNLADNGGPTFTHLLIGGSPAIDASSGGGLDTDQRGVARPLAGDFDGNEFWDIGAVEMGGILCGIQNSVEPKTYEFVANGDAMSIEITNDGSNLECIRVTNFPQNHPDAIESTETGQYWDIDGLQDDQVTPATVDFVFSITLPHSSALPDEASICKNTGGTNWACDRTGADTAYVWLDGVTDGFSDWAAGDSAPTAVSLLSFKAQAGSTRTGVVAALLAAAGAVAISLRRLITGE